MDLQPQTQYTLSGVTPGSAKPVFTLADGNFKPDNPNNNSITVDKTGNPRIFTLPWPKSKACYRVMCRLDSKPFIKVPPVILMPRTKYDDHNHFTDL